MEKKGRLQTGGDGLALRVDNGGEAVKRRDAHLESQAHEFRQAANEWTSREMERSVWKPGTPPRWLRSK